MIIFCAVAMGILGILAGLAIHLACAVTIAMLCFAFWLAFVLWPRLDHTTPGVFWLSVIIVAPFIVCLIATSAMIGPA